MNAFDLTCPLLENVQNYFDRFPELFWSLEEALIVLVRGLGGLFRTITGLTVSGIAFPFCRLDGHHGLKERKENVLLNWVNMVQNRKKSFVFFVVKIDIKLTVRLFYLTLPCEVIYKWTLSISNLKATRELFFRHYTESLR